VRLTKLQMQGFKSFADDTTMQFENGVTAVVGPNGCGKSNVSDAVRWVLGEQRARMLRGAKMEEVIFQGSSARRAVNIAEVSLYFDNDDGSLPTPFREVVVARRLSRSGESEYLLNGAPCRLRDIHDLMRGTGLGADSGVVIESRMIDALLSDRADDRRELFEEAAGVSLYRDRRRSTERRLEETTHDLARLDDLIGEVQSQVRSLARQRKRAERHAEITARRYAVELTLATREMASWREELAVLEQRVGELRAFVPQSEQRVHDAEEARDAAYNERAAAEAQRNEASRIAAAQQQQVQALHADIAVAEERQRNATERRRRAEAERQEGEAVDGRLSADRARAREDRERLGGELTLSEQAFAEVEIAEETARRAVTTARQAADDADRAARDLRDAIRASELQREAMARETTELDQRAASLEAERSELVDAAAVLARDVRDADDTVAVATTMLERATEALRGARERLQQAREHDADARARLGQAENAVTSLEGRVHALERLERERVGLAPAAVRLLRERESFGDGAIVGPLYEFVNATSAPAMLVERFLGATLHAVVVRDALVARAVQEWHARANPGPLLLLPLDALDGDGLSDEGELLSQIEPAEPAAPWVRALLRRAKPIAEGAAFVDARGAVWLPGSGGTGDTGPLRRRAELFTLRSELAGAEAVRREAVARAQETRTELVAAETAVSHESETATATRIETERAQARRAELERLETRSTRDLDDAAAQHERLTSRRAELAGRLAELEAQTHQMANLVADREAAVHAAREQLMTSERSLETARDRRADAQVEQAKAQARVQVAAERELRLDEEHEAAASRLVTLSAELEQLFEADHALAEQLAVAHAELEARNTNLREAQGRLDAAEHRVATADTTLTDAEHALDRARLDAHQQSEELHHAELRFTELSGRRAAIRGRLETEWRRPLEDLLASFEPLDVLDEALRAEADTLRAQLDALGPVNPLAIEEHEDEVKRLDFLTSQRNDLAEARNSLHQAIKEIDVTARQLFIDTFAQIRGNFRQIFMTLFGGGECDLRLENPDTPLDCDIEIHASPRGKRTQRIHLLSSGERALVALSLLFGIFLTKPSPFCLLDEVDAPLDDANIGRFVRMLNTFKQKTQFIVITHNPRTTTEAADAVYGVTMQEPGVSSIVSVRMRGSPVADDVSVSDEPVAREPLAASA
jgi:chromosome segregation protein